MCNPNVASSISSSCMVQEGRVEPKSIINPKVAEHPIIIVGAGVAGVSAAIALSDIGLESILLDRLSSNDLLNGAGINLQAKAIKALNSLGILTKTLIESGKEITKQSYFCPDGRHIYTLDKSGSGHSPGQVAIHRGKLLRLLLDAVDSRDNIKLLTSNKVVEIDQKSSLGPIRIKVETPQSATSLNGSMVLGADGINSIIRNTMISGNSNADPVHYHGVTHYRGVTENFPSFLDGSTMIVAGGVNVKIVAYPITNHCDKGLQTINWVITVQEEASNDLSVSSHSQHILGLLAANNFKLDFLDLKALICNALSIRAWPMVDLNPLKTWVDRRIGLIGDAAHGMLPVGSGGAMAALLDALALRESFEKSGNVPVFNVLRLYQSMRYDDVSLQQQKCRQQTAEHIVQMAIDNLPKDSNIPSEFGQHIRNSMTPLHRLSFDTLDSTGETKKRVLIIGGGASGLASCKEFAEKGFHPVVFESGATFGGVFRDAYPRLELTSSSSFTAFSDFPPRDQLPTMWTASEYLSYLHEYAVENNIFGNIQFNHRVVGVKRLQKEMGGDDTLWEVTVQNSATNNIYSLKGGHLVVCVGSNAKPNIPIFSGQDQFSGRIMHTSQIDSFKMFRGKRVLCLGIGESGSDVPYWIAKEPGTSVTISVRGLGWCAPRRRPLDTGLPTDLNTNRVLWGLPRIFGQIISSILAYADSRMESDPAIRRMGLLNSKHPVGMYNTYGTKSINFLVAMEHLGTRFVGSTIESMGPDNSVCFADGSDGEYDIVLLNTGYSKSNFEGFCSPFETGRDQALFNVLSEASYVRNLFKRVFHPAKRNLYFIGFARPGFASIPAIAETQARWAASIAAGSCTPLPSEKDMIAEIAADKFSEETQFDGAARRVTALVDYLPYVNGIASLLGATPPYLKLLFTNPAVLLKIFLGPATVAQFRLNGPDAKPDIAFSTIKGYPPIPMRRVTFISLGLYIMTLLVILISLAVPITFEGRKSLQPVGFPPLRNLPLRIGRYMLFWLHLVALAYFYSRVVAKSEVTFLIVAIIGNLEIRRHWQDRERVRATRELLTPAAEMIKFDTCKQPKESYGTMNSPAQKIGSKKSPNLKLSRVALSTFVSAIRELLRPAAGMIKFDTYKQPKQSYGTMNSQAQKISPNKSPNSRLSHVALPTFVCVAVLTILHSSPGNIFVSGFKDSFKLSSRKPFIIKKGQLYYPSLTTTDASEKISHHLGKVHDISGLERIALTSSGNLQRVFSAYYHQPVTVSIDKSELADDSKKDDMAICALYNRIVTMSVNDEIFCRAASEIMVYSSEVAQILKDHEIGIGQLFQVLNVRPCFALHDAGRNKEGGLWRLYSLECNGIVRCEIREDFSPDAWNLEFR